MPTLASIDPGDVRLSAPIVALPARTFLEAASQSFKAGTLLTLSSAGYANASIATGSNYVASGEIIAGIANSDATGTTGSNVSVTPVSGGVRLKLPVYHGTPASAVTAITNIGESFELRRDADHGLMVDLGNTGSPVVTIVAIGQENPVGTAYGYVWVEFIAAEVLGA